MLPEVPPATRTGDAPGRDRYVRVLTIAGSDSSGGAGIQADLKTCAALGCYGMSAITAVTAQNTRAVTAVQGVTPALLQAQLDAVVSDIGVDAVKIGMLYSAALARVVAQAIDAHRLKPVILDPVLVSSSGRPLLDADAVAVLQQELFPRVTLITPNLDEAALLLGRALPTPQAVEQGAYELQAHGAPAVLIKGGHQPGALVQDLLLLPDGARHWLSAPRIATANAHGTGCTLSAAIAAYMALGHTLEAAVRAAHLFVRAALQSGVGVRTGAGSGPLNHGFAPQPLRRVALAPSGHAAPGSETT